MIQEALANHRLGRSARHVIRLALDDQKPEEFALTSETIFGSRPIAELHPYTTVMFADLDGFTAWSSQRDPCQVFTLLELLFHSFDTIAKRRNVYKVETRGDIYVGKLLYCRPSKCIPTFALTLSPSHNEFSGGWAPPST